MITNYIPNTCKYSVSNLKKVVHIFSESENVIHIDNGEAYVTSGITDFQTIYATSVEFAESTSYDDRFKFEKTVAVTCDGFLKLDALNEKYYVVLEDENGIMWVVNVDFPSFVTYTYTLADGTDETVFTFNVLSNFPTLKLNATINNSYECKDYSLANVKKLKMNLRENVTIDYKNHILYDSANKPYYIVKFNEGTLKMEESYDGFNVTTSIEFKINFDDYKSSWHYNLLEYQDNKYIAVTDHLACGFEMGLIPSYSIQGSSQMGQGDMVTIKLVGTSQRGSEWAEEWTEATLIPDYVWLLSNEWICDGDIPPVPPTGGTKWIAYYSDSHTDSALCDDTNTILVNDFEKTNLTGFTIGDCVTTLGSGVFGQCTGLTEITIPSGITYIGGGAFYECTGLTGITCEATTPPQLSDHVFHETYCLIYVPCESVDTYKNNMYWSEYARRIQGIPPCGQPTPTKFTLTLNDSSTVSAECDSTSSVTSGEVATQYSGSVTSAVIGQCVNSIGEHAFAYCTSLTSIDIPSSVTSIGNAAFGFCSGLTSITIPSSVTSIDNAAFSHCNGLTSVTIPSGVTSIGDSTFYVCRSLTSITIPSGVTSIGDGAFFSCSGLTSIVIPSGVTSIGNSTFYNCRSLTNITIPNNVTSIGLQAFHLCTSLTSVTIPSGVTSIGNAAFQTCSGLTSIVIPSGVTTIDTYAFRNCSSLQSIIVEATTPSALGDYAFYNTNNCVIYVPCASVDTYKAAEGWSAYANRITCVNPPTSAKYILTLSDSSTVSAECDSTSAVTSGEVATQYSGSVVSAVIAQCVNSIGERAFNKCYGLTSITIGSSVTEIGNYAFRDCSGLTEVIIPDSVTVISGNAFSHCYGLTSCTIGSSVTEIGVNAFRLCSGLTSITVEAVTPPTLGTFSFNDTNDCSIYVPAASLETYKAASGWSSYASRIQAIP